MVGGAKIPSAAYRFWRMAWRASSEAFPHSAATRRQKARQQVGLQRMGFASLRVN